MKFEESKHKIEKIWEFAEKNRLNNDRLKPLNVKYSEFNYGAIREPISADFIVKEGNNYYINGITLLRNVTEETLPFILHPTIYFEIYNPKV